MLIIAGGEISSGSAAKEARHHVFARSGDRRSDFYRVLRDLNLAVPTTTDNATTRIVPISMRVVAILL